jgi:hypothetical protein
VNQGLDEDRPADRVECAVTWGFPILILRHGCFGSEREPRASSRPGDKPGRLSAFCDCGRRELPSSLLPSVV